jgi:anti-sigma B factor antagonist
LIRADHREEGTGTITQASNVGSLLTISVTQNEGAALVCLDGRLTIDSSPLLRDRLLAMLHGERLEKLTLDLSDVPYMDLSGVATLLEALKIARARKTELELTGLHDRPRYLLEVTGLLSLFETCDRRSAPSIPKAQ